MSKNKHYKENRDKSQLKNDLHTTPASDSEYAVFDDLVDEDTDSKEDKIENLDVEVLEDQLREDAVNAEDETVLPEDNLSAKLEEANAALEKEKKEYLFLMADFDNFRKRVVKEKADLIKNAAEKVLKGLLPIVDDFERGLEAAGKVENASSISQGMELIYNKLVKYLADNGVKAMESTGSDFDAEIHEAIASIPTGDESKKGKVIDTTQKGYMLNDKVLRHAKVVVGE